MIEAQNFIKFLSCDKVHKRTIFSKTFPLIKLLHFSSVFVCNSSFDTHVNCNTLAKMIMLSWYRV